MTAPEAGPPPPAHPAEVARSTQPLAAASPEWRLEFPFRWNEDEAMTRRELLRFLVAASAGLAGTTWALALRGLWPVAPQPVRVRVARLADVPVNRALLFSYPADGGKPAILLRLPGGRLAAYSDVCTHLSCAVQYLGDGRHLHCPCHNGMFDARTGEVLYGPPTRPLPRIDLAVENGEVWAIREVYR